MVARKNLKQIGTYLYEIPRETRPDMRVPARIYADEEIVSDALEDRSIEQLINTATLPGIVKYALAMPDIHQGYGFSIGGVVATRDEDGVVSPGGVGYDINCGVRLLASDMEEGAVRPYLSDLATALYHQIPSGVGVAGFLRLSDRDMEEVLETGARWTRKKGMADDHDLEHTEERGAMPGADAGKVSAGPRSGARTSSAPWAPATTSPRSTWSTRSSTRPSPRLSASSPARWYCKSIADRAGLATRSAPTTCNSFRA